MLVCWENLLRKAGPPKLVGEFAEAFEFSVQRTRIRRTTYEAARALAMANVLSDGQQKDLLPGVDAQPEEPMPCSQVTNSLVPGAHRRAFSPKWNEINPSNPSKRAASRSRGGRPRAASLTHQVRKTGCLLSYRMGAFSTSKGGSYASWTSSISPRCSADYIPGVQIPRHAAIRLVRAAQSM